jgi:hypothetical protein
MEDKSEFFQEIMDIHDNWIAIIGCIDIVHFNTRFSIRNDYNLADTNPLANKFNQDDFYIIIGKGSSDMIIESLEEHEFEVDREGFYEIKALLKWIPGDYDEYGRCTLRDYLEIEHIELKFISTFESRNREEKLNQILLDDFDKLFDL